MVVGLTQYQITQAHNIHQEALRLFREVTIVENALKQQIVAAIDPKYLKAVHSSITQQTNQSIDDIFSYLFDT